MILTFTNSFLVLNDNSSRGHYPTSGKKRLRHEKGADARTLSVEICMDCVNFMLEVKILRAFTHNAQYVKTNAHLNLIKGIFRNKPSIIAEMENSWSG